VGTSAPNSTTNPDAWFIIGYASKPDVVFTAYVMCLDVT